MTDPQSDPEIQRMTLCCTLLVAASLAACDAPTENNAAAANEAAPAAAAGAYPSAAVLTAFRTACSDLGSIEAAAGGVREAGWTELDTTDGTPIAPLMDFAEQQGNRAVAAAGGTVDPMRSFRRTVEGEELYLVVSQVRIEGNEVTGCRLYDVDEPRRITVEEATRWIGRPPTETEDTAELMRGSWTPGFSGGRDSFELLYIPAESPARQYTQIAGIGMIIDQTRPLR